MATALYERMNLKSIEFWMLIVAALFILAGLIFLIRPEAQLMLTPTNGPFGLENGTDSQVVSKTGMRIYGCLTLIFGAAIAWFFWPRRDQR